MKSSDFIAQIRVATQPLSHGVAILGLQLSTFII